MHRVDISTSTELNSFTFVVVYRPPPRVGWDCHGGVLLGTEVLALHRDL